ncbi:12891_t:CDS:2, partial [Cetraspora pellucida]
QNQIDCIREDSTLSSNDAVSSILTPTETGTKIVCNTYSTKDHWKIDEEHNNQKTQIDVFRQVTKEEIDKSIIDLVVSTGISFSILDNLLFRQVARNLRYVTNSYKILHSMTILRHLTGNIFNSRLEFVKNLLAKSPRRISLTCDRWHSNIHRCHYIVVTGSWISEDWRVVNIILSFQKSGQTAEDILSTIITTLEAYNIKEKIFTLTMNNTTTNKAVGQLLKNKLQNQELISIVDMCWNSTLAMFERYIYLHPAIYEMCSKESSMPSCLENEEFVVLESFCQLLKPFEGATLILLKEQCNPISDAIM